MNNRGFLFTILTFLLALSVLVLAGFFAMEKNPVDVSAKKVRNIFDDVKTDVEYILQLSASVERSGGYVTVSLQDHIPLADGNYTMSRYDDFLGGIYSTRLNTNISLTGVLDSNFTLEPYGLTYGYPDFNKGEVRFYNKSGDADGVDKYLIDLGFDDNLQGVVEYSVPGSLLIGVNATFANATYDKAFSVSRNDNSSWIFRFNGSNVTLRVGRNTIDGIVRDSSMTVSTTGMGVDLSTDIVLTDVNRTVGVRSGIYLTVDDGIDRQDYIWLTRG